MAELLALSWERSRLTGIELSSGSSRPKILNAFSSDWPETPNANWLREILRQNGIGSRNVVLALPREDIVLRLLELPSVSDAELPTLVRFQAAARSTQSLDQLLLDYLPLPVRATVPQNDVWLATTPQTTIHPIRELLTEAGLELSQVTVSSMCLSELIARGEAVRSLDPNGASLVVLRDGVRMELAVICQRQFIAAHAVKWSSPSEIPPVAKMLAEVSRLLVQVQAWLPDGTLQRAWVIGENTDVGELPEAIGKRWQCPVERFDPLSDSDIALGSVEAKGPAAQYAIVAGLSLIQSGPRIPKLDLLHPRQPPPKRDPRKPLYAAAAAAGLLLTAFTTAVIAQSLGSYDNQIEAALTKEKTLKRDLEAGAPTFKAAKELADWRSHDIDQLQQLAELYRVMNGTERIIIADYTFEPNLSGDSVARIRGYGYARDRNDAQRLYQKLQELPKFQTGIRPKPFTEKTPDSQYDVKFELDMDLAATSTKPSATTKSK